VEAASEEGHQGVLTTAQQQLKERVTFTCRELPIDTVLMQLAEQADVDIIKSPKVTGNVTVKVTDVPLDEALNNILAAHGWTYVASENMIRVMPLGERKKEKEQEIIEPYIWQITYADVADVAAALKDFVSKDGKITSNKGTNHIIVSDTPSTIKAIDRFISQIDRQTPQVMVEARIYDITTTEGFEIGVQWSAGRNTPLTSFTENERTFERTDTLESETDYVDQQTVWDDQLEWEKHLLHLADPITYPVDGVPADPGITENKKPALTGYTITETESITKEDDSWRLDSTGTNLPFRTSKPFVGGTFTQTGGGTLRFGLLNDMIDLDIALTMLKSEIEAKLLANPRVLVLDNETATIKIVKEIPYVQSFQSVGAISTIASVQFKDVGVQLQVTPHIAREGMIRLKLKPEFGVESSVIEPGSKAQEAPAVDTRILETVALVRDSQTVVMGGLRKKQVSKNLTKVPVLGDIPLLGDLFRYETENEITNELVVFITPSIVTQHELSDVEEMQLETTRYPSPGMSKAGTKRENPSDIGSEKAEVAVAESVEPEEG
jgi:type II secretory pathway component GspD/PulD (secretin)